MLSLYTLIITIHFVIGIQEPLSFEGKHLYESQRECEKVGQVIADWLAQDFVIAQYSCVKEDDK